MPRHIALDEAKTRLADLVDAAASGEEIVITENDHPRAKLVRVEQPAPRRRRENIRFGTWEGLLELPDGKIPEMPEDIVRMMLGEDDDPMDLPPDARPDR